METTGSGERMEGVLARDGRTDVQIKLGEWLAADLKINKDIDRDKIARSKKA